MERVRSSDESDLATIGGNEKPERASTEVYSPRLDACSSGDVRYLRVKDIILCFNSAFVLDFKPSPSMMP